MNAEVSGQAPGYCDTLVVAEFDDPLAAMRAYEALRDAEVGGRLRVDGALAVSCDEDGKMRVEETSDHATGTGLKWGAVGGLVLGVIFPPSIIASTVAFGAVGGLLGKLRSSHHKTELASQLDGAVGPGKAGVVALIMRPTVPIAEQSFVGSNTITVVDVDDATVAQITEAARTAG